MQRETLLANTLGCALEVGKPVLIGFLMSTNKKVGKLPARRAGLCQEFGYRELQQVLGKMNCRLKRQAGDG